MKRVNRELLVLLRTALMSKEELELEVAGINRLLKYSFHDDRFCKAHELVANTRITQRKSKILRARRQSELKPFYFLLNKN
ncbi:MAG: hypothetical protein JNN29_09470 [Chitinophagaceae bacterium]|nr:hypothetical protein [Chitinophagaceae bacterium]